MRGSFAVEIDCWQQSECNCIAFWNALIVFNNLSTSVFLDVLVVKNGFLVKCYLYTLKKRSGGLDLLKIDVQSDRFCGNVTIASSAKSIGFSEPRVL